MLSRCFSLLIVLSYAFAAFAEETPASAALQSLRFETDLVTHYVYRSKQASTQYINDDTVKIESTISWKFALRCLSSDDKSARLRLTIQVIKAHVKGPAFEHSINTSDPQPQVKTPVIGHLSLLNGVSLELIYDYTQQALTAVTGAESIHKRFKKIFPDDEFEETEQPEMKLIKAQFSNQALLRLWREIIRPGRSGTDVVTLAEPLSLPVQRQWQPQANDIVPYELKYSAAKDATAIDMPLGQHKISTQIDEISGSGKIRVVDGVLLEAIGSTAAKMRMRALTQSLKQELSIEWALQRLEQYQGDAEASEDTAPE